MDTRFGVSSVKALLASERKNAVKATAPSGVFALATTGTLGSLSVVVEDVGGGAVVVDVPLVAVVVGAGGELVAGGSVVAPVHPATPRAAARASPAAYPVVTRSLTSRPSQQAYTLVRA